MCFSATASFTASAVLVPIGTYSVGLSYRADRRYLVLASFPLLFGIQQAVEGWAWLAIESSAQSQIRAAALGFLFFAFFLWPLLVPLSAYLVEENRERQAIFFVVSLVGCIFGISIYAPLFLDSNWLQVEIARGSIQYEVTLIYDDLVPTTGMRLIYASITVLPLLTSTIASIRIFGVLILLSIVVGFLFFSYAFTSIWCFIAAIISVYIVRVMQGIPRKIPIV